jgi:CxxC-x17-CxxC domain-containing protein
MDAEKLKNAALSGIAPFAVTTFRNREKVFGIKSDDRRRHVYVIGKTGMGKTTLIENMVYSDIIAGHGVCYVDPHGDTAEKMLEWIPTSRINDVIYFNPADLDFPISFNVLEKVSVEHRHLISSGLIGVFKKLWADSWGPRLEYILRNAILALLEYPDSTLLGINRLLVDKEYRRKVVVKITDPVVKSFWVDEFPRWNERVLQEVISPIQNKVGQFLSTSLIRNVVGQVKSSINLRKIMDDQKILIMNLSKGRIGEDASHLLGAMMITKIQLAAMSRVEIKEEDRKDFYLYVDEFQNFTTESFADILSEARKYRLNLIIAHQYIEQLGEVVQPAVFGNVGTLICFRVGAADAEFLEKEFEPDLIMQDLVNLPKYHVYLKLMIDGVSSEPFSAKGLPPVYSESQGNEEKVIAVSRERYAKEKDIVEDKIRRWSESKQQQVHDDKFEKDKTKKAEYEARKQGPEGSQQGQGPGAPFVRKDAPQQRTAFDSRPAPPVTHSAPSRLQETRTQTNREVKKGFPAICYSCKKEIEVPFKPDNVRPVFCKDCLKNARRGNVEIRPDEAIKADKQPGVSLSAISAQTVDFKGKPVGREEINHPKADQPLDEKDSGSANAGSVKEIKKEATSTPKRPIAPEVEVEKPKEETPKEEVKPVEERKNEVKEPVMEKVKEEAPRIEKPKENLPSANLLGDDNEKSLNQGETVDL